MHALFAIPAMCGVLAGSTRLQTRASRRCIVFIAGHVCVQAVRRLQRSTLAQSLAIGIIFYKTPSIHDVFHLQRASADRQSLAEGPGAMTRPAFAAAHSSFTPHSSFAQSAGLIHVSLSSRVLGGEASVMIEKRNRDQCQCRLSVLIDCATIKSLDSTFLVENIRRF